MTIKFNNFTLDRLFTIKSGDFHATKELDNGDIPLISCGVEEQGLVGYFDIPKEKIYSHCVSVAYNGLPLTAHFHPYLFGAKDDIAVLIPKRAYKAETLYYLAALLNKQSWRYSYGRKCFKEKLKRVSVPFPITGDGEINEKAIQKFCSFNLSSLLPSKKIVPLTFSRPTWKEWNITDLFDIFRGDFHSLADLDSGTYMTISRVTTDNGVTGYFDKPDNATIYPSGCITVSTVGGDAFVQLDQFIVTDNVLICLPKKRLQLTTIYFVAFILNRQKWRYSYGRQCYLTKFKSVKLYLPATQEGVLDEVLMKKIVSSSTYWESLSRKRLVSKNAEQRDSKK